MAQGPPYRAAVTVSPALSARLRERFLELLERHVYGLQIRGVHATGLCPFHPDRSPSFTADLNKGVWYCFPCGEGGGVRRFAERVGEGWDRPPQAPRRARAHRAAQARRREAEAQARAILRRRKDEREDALWAAWREANMDAYDAAELLALFHRRPDLAADFPDLVARTERAYGEAVFQRAIAQARLDGELI
jgi:CHC2 zinc finger